jgi:hypothetical protein
MSVSGLASFLLPNDLQGKLRAFSANEYAALAMHSRPFNQRTGIGLTSATKRAGFGREFRVSSFAK